MKNLIKKCIETFPIQKNYFYKNVMIYFLFFIVEYLTLKYSNFHINF